MQSTRSFKEREWACKCARCKQVTPHKMQAHVMEQVQAIRDEAGRPLTLTSAYRCPDHPEEAKKTQDNNSKGITHHNVMEFFELCAGLIGSLAR